jgi:hypothetical protein
VCGGPVSSNSVEAPGEVSGLMFFADVPGVRMSLNPILLRTLFFAACFGTTVCAAEVSGTGREDGLGQGRQFQFNIPAQALRDALLDYTKVTGLGVLVDDAVASDRRSSPVSGSFTAEQALRTLLAGTSFDFQYIAAGAFTLVPAPVISGRDAGRDERYFRTIQNVVKYTLCSRAQTLPGGYRAVIQLWINASGIVLRSALLGSTGNPARDQMLSDTLDGLPLGAAPPAGLPQPVTLIILPRAPDVTQDCGPADNGVARVRG